MQPEDFITIEKIIDQKIEKSDSRFFGVIKDYFDDQFSIIHEKFQMMDEKMDRNFAEIREEVNFMKNNIDDNSLDILELQQDQIKIKSDIQEIKQELYV